MIDEKRLSEVLSEGIVLRAIEPHVFSVDAESANEYDGRFGSLYDVVACSYVYNRLVWGYRTGLYGTLCLEALSASSGWMLDAGCGSLAFTAAAYGTSATRPVVLLDQSINLLRMAKERLLRVNGSFPENILLLHGDASRLPFVEKSFTTVLALNLLHVLPDPAALLREFRRVLVGSGTLTCTTLVKGGRLADRYLDRLAKAGLLHARSVDEVLAFFDDAGVPHVHATEGNLATIRGQE